MEKYFEMKGKLDETATSDPSYNDLQKEVFNLLKNVRENNLDIDNVMEPRDYIHPSEYDVFLLDVKHNDLVGPIAERLGIKYLEVQSEYDSSRQSPVVEGILYGTNFRPMVNLVVWSKRFQIKVNVIFLVDTGSPCLYICSNAMDALGFRDYQPSTFDLIFREKVYEAVLSPLVVAGKEGHYHDINLIGAFFLSLSGAKLSIYYPLRSVTLELG